MEKEMKRESGNEGEVRSTIKGVYVKRGLKK